LVYSFESFSLDPDRRELRRGLDLVAVQPQVFDVLSYLVRNRDRIVRKNDLIAGVWDGRIVSESTLSSRITAVRQAVGDSGKRQRLIRTIPRKGYRFVGVVRQPQGRLDEEVARSSPPADRERSTQTKRAAPPFLDKPSIGVLPFSNISGDPALDFFIDGLVEDITTALSQFRWLSVMARRSSLAFKGRAMDIKHVGRELGVRYVLEGSVRKAQHRLRTTAQLIDTTTGAHLWANRFDGELAGHFDLQDEITASVVGAIGPRLEQLEINRTRRQPAYNPDPYHCYLRGVGSVHQWTRDSMTDALGLFHQAIEIDPEFASAYGMAAYCYVQRQSYGWITDRPQETAECARLARQAAELGKDDAVALCKAAHAISAFVGDVDSGAVFIEQALLVNPNLAAGWYVSGWIKLFLGEPEAAIEHLARALRLSPFDPLIFKMHTAIAYAHLLAGRDDDASVAAENILRTRPNYLTAVRGAAASHALAGRLDRARTLMAHMRQRDPALHISNLTELIPFRRTGDFARWAEGLHKSGLPD
jgi:TolB-like protein/Tfp pilus assembly protein PilF